jgi:hypothetical protein
MIDSVPRSLSNFRSSRHVYVGPYPDTCTLVFAATSVCSQRPDTPCNSVILSVNTTSKYVLSSYTRKLRLRRAASRSRKRGGYSFATFFLVPSCCPSDTVASLKLATVQCTARYLQISSNYWIRISLTILKMQCAAAS